MGLEGFVWRYGVLFEEGKKRGVRFVGERRGRRRES